MDPALQRLLREPEADEVEAIIRLASPGSVPPWVRLIARFNDVATCRVARARLLETWADESVFSLKGARALAQDRDPGQDAEREPPVPAPGDRRRPVGMDTTGRGVVVAVIDWGFDFAHDNFRNRDGSTRILALWDQTNDEGPSPLPYGYGRVFTRDAIDAALTSPEPYAALRYHPGVADRGKRGAHGTHVLDIAAGNGQLPGSIAGLAPEADLLLVHLASRGTGGEANLGDSVTLLEALDWIRGEAGQRPWVVNMSVGTHGGPHTGLTLVEMGIDRLLTGAPGRCVVQSTGNYFAANAHAGGRLRPGERRTLRWRVGRADRSPNELELWYPEGDRLAVTLSPPRGRRGLTVALGEDAPVEVAGRVVGHFYHRAHDPGNGDHHVDIFLDAGAPAGEWRLRLFGDDVVDGRFHCWVERDSACRSCQSRLHPDDADTHSTTGSICNGWRNLAVGAYDAHDPARGVARFSSSGPTVDGRIKPDLVAPGVGVIAARSTPRGISEPRPSLVANSGTSMAAPHVTGTVANMFEAAGRPLAIDETRRLLLSQARQADLEQDAMRIGSGYLDIAGAVAATREWVLRHPDDVEPMHAAEQRGAVRIPNGPNAAAHGTVPAATHRPPSPLVTSMAVPTQEAWPVALDPQPESETMYSYTDEMLPGSSFGEYDEEDDTGSLIEAALVRATPGVVLLDPEGAPAGPAAIFDGLLGFHGVATERHYREALDVVAGPGDPLAGQLRAGDILLERALGEGSLAYAKRITEDQTSAAEAGEDPWPCRSRGPGAGMHHRRLAHNRLVVRARSPETYSPALEREAPGLPADDEESYPDEGSPPAPMAVPSADPVPFAPDPPTGSYWPIITSHRRGREVTYIAADGSRVGARRGRRFLASRSNGKRNHVGVDLFANFGDPVVAIEDGRILKTFPFCCGDHKTTNALLVEHSNVVVNYGEVAPPDSLRRTGLARGSQVRAGQVIGYVGRNPGGSSMIHFETYTPGTTRTHRFMRGHSRPAALLNPTAYLLKLQEHGLRTTAGTGGGSSGSGEVGIRALQQALNRLLGLSLTVDGVAGNQTTAAVRRFQAQSGLSVDGQVGSQTRAAIQAALARLDAPHAPPAASPLPPPVPAAPPAPRAVIAWEGITVERRVLHVMERLVTDYGYPINGAAGLVGNLRFESGVLPNRIEGSQLATPMRAHNFARVVTDFTAEQVMNRNRASGLGPRLPGIGLAQWTWPARRRGLFEHRFEGRRLGADILFDMDAQVDYLVTELGSQFAGVDRVLRATGVTLNDASDDVAYRFESPRSILDADRRRLPRTDPAVQVIFDERRGASRGALRAYREAHPEIAEDIRAGEAIDDLDGGGEWDVQDDSSRLLESTLAIDSVFGPLSLEAVESAIERLESAAEHAQTAAPLPDERSESMPMDDEAVSADRFVRWFRQALARLGGLAAGAGAVPGRPAVTGIAVCAGLNSPEVIDRFASGSANLLPTHRPQVVRIARCIVASLGAAAPVDTLSVVGHTGSVGSQASNLLLGRRRAEAVKQELLRTVDRMRPGAARGLVVKLSSQGEARPLPDPALSRRVEVFMTLPAQPPVVPSTRIRLRRNVTDLSAAERTALTDAINELKRSGSYHQFVRDHYNSRATAHRQPAFLPWHRQFILNFESELRAIDPSVTLPYWDWSSDPGIDAAGNPMWNPSMIALMGGNGTGADDAVTSGPFAGWTVADSSGVATSVPLQRSFGTESWAPSLPTASEVATAMGITPYDDSPWDEGVATGGFRNHLEGWFDGNSLHNVVHGWVGGAMVPPTSPNDPCFFLHHAFVDKVWADWQAAHPGLEYLPATEQRRSGKSPAWGRNDDVPVFDVAGSSPVTFKPADADDLGNLADHKGTAGIQVQYS